MMTNPDESLANLIRRGQENNRYFTKLAGGPPEVTVNGAQLTFSIRPPENEMDMGSSQTQVASSFVNHCEPVLTEIVKHAGLPLPGSYIVSASSYTPGEPFRITYSSKSWANGGGENLQAAAARISDAFREAKADLGKDSVQRTL
jgi:hypothetical protein